MKTKEVYRFTRPGGGVTVSVNKPSGKHEELFRLIADDGMILTDGVCAAAVIDTDTPGLWRETEKQEEVEI